MLFQSSNQIAQLNGEVLSQTFLSILQWLNQRLWKFVSQLNTIGLIFPALCTTAKHQVFCHLSSSCGVFGILMYTNQSTKSRAASMSLFSLGALRFLCKSEAKFKMNHRKAECLEVNLVPPHLLWHGESTVLVYSRDSGCCVSPDTMHSLLPAQAAHWRQGLCTGLYKSTRGCNQRHVLYPLHLRGL